MRLKLFVPLILILVSCSSIPKVIDQPHDVRSPSAPIAYIQALDNISRGKYPEARMELENFLAQTPVSPYTQVANFNIAYSLELERSFKAAADKYREVATSTSKSAPRLQAYSLYRLSYCLEALGDDTQVVAVLTDLQSRKNLLEPEIENAEIPARLAAAYSRVGNVELAQQLYSQAESAMLRYRRGGLSSNDPNLRPPWLSKTLYHMGRANLRDATWENFEVVVRPLNKAQIFLLEAAELNDPLWSKKASDDLSTVYKNLWAVIQKPPTADADIEIIKQRANQQRQWEMTFQLVDLINDLSRHKLNDQNSVYVQSIFIEIDKINKQVKKMLSQQRVGSDLTPAARKRILGQRPLPKLPRKTTTEHPVPMTTPPPATQTQSPSDPNL